MKKITLYVSVVVIFFLSSGSMAHGKTLRVASFGSDIPAITSLAPSFNPDSYSVITQIFDSLIHLSLEGKRIPAPATSWKLIAEKTYEFKFREGVKFHNDEDFDVNDIKFTCKKIIDPATKAGNAWIIGTVKEVQWKRDRIGKSSSFYCLIASPVKISETSGDDIPCPLGHRINSLW
jgi:peptide/nickel transport system substrate-binding protein